MTDAYLLLGPESFLVVVDDEALKHAAGLDDDEVLGGARVIPHRPQQAASIASEVEVVLEGAVFELQRLPKRRHVAAAVLKVAVPDLEAAVVVGDDEAAVRHRAQVAFDYESEMTRRIDLKAGNRIEKN